ncbi:hypothetical protein EDC48_10347 [Gibbsiella quercinecans]|nr:hypothetical protein EDC48_10347 [Gibbsiella quercinecans]
MVATPTHIHSEFAFLCLAARHLPIEEVCDVR